MEARAGHRGLRNVNVSTNQRWQGVDHISAFSMMSANAGVAGACGCWWRRSCLTHSGEWGSTPLPPNLSSRSSNMVALLGAYVHRDQVTCVVDSLKYLDEDAHRHLPSAAFTLSGNEGSTGAPFNATCKLWTAHPASSRLSLVSNESRFDSARRQSSTSQGMPEMCSVMARKLSATPSRFQIHEQHSSTFPSTALAFLPTLRHADRQASSTRPRGSQPWQSSV